MFLDLSASIAAFEMVKLRCSIACSWPKQLERSRSFFFNLIPSDIPPEANHLPYVFMHRLFNSLLSRIYMHKCIFKEVRIIIIFFIIIFYLLGRKNKCF